MRFWAGNYRPLAAEFVDNLQGMATLKTFGVADRRGRELEQKSAGVRDAAIRLISVSGVYRGVMMLAAAAGVAGGLAAGAFRLPAAAASAPASRAEPTGKPATERVEPVLRFTDITFRYRRAGPPALADVSFELMPGETVAIVGASGAGKTTVASLVLRFFDPESGRILMSGTDLRDLSPDEVRRQVALVSQDTFLFHASVRDNLLLAAPGADDDALVRAAGLASASGFIENLPQGYDTIVGERGLRLSGGQRQRIAIARALLKDAPILILDEATSSVDVAAEAEIQAALGHIRRGRSTLVIAHRLSTVQDADRILVLDQGHVTETGTHEQLLGHGGGYARLVNAQRLP